MGELEIKRLSVKKGGLHTDEMVAILIDNGAERTAAYHYGQGIKVLPAVIRHSNLVIHVNQVCSR